jgi:hypothetical protein
VEGDAVVGQHAFAQYVNGAGWVGTLDEMEPGEGYALYLTGGGELLYPPTPEKVAPRPPLIREVPLGGPDWDVAAQDYEAIMIVVAEITMQDTPLGHADVKVAVTSGETVRGVGEVRLVDALDQHLAFIMIYGSLDAKEELRVHVYDGATGTEYRDVATVHYTGQTMLGQVASPVYLELTNAGSAPSLLDLPESFALYPNYPNPFNPFTIIGYDLPEPATVTLSVYDVIGRRVVNLVDQEQVAGRHKAVFDGRMLASGMYLYRITAGDFTEVGKMILVK